MVGFKTEKVLNDTKKIELHNDFIVDKPQMASVASQNNSRENLFLPAPPKIGKAYIGFKEALAFRESRGNYFVVNNFGYLGKYQFGKSALKFYGVKSRKKFLKSPKAQEKLFRVSLERTKWVLRKEIKNYNGKKVGGVLITESGILAAAHLAGAGNVKRFFKHKGNYRFNDAFGTSIRNYMKSFANYDLSSVKADEMARF